MVGAPARGGQSALLPSEAEQRGELPGDGRCDVTSALPPRVAELVVEDHGHLPAVPRPDV